jgi:lipopolysaccharide export system permease protein
MFVLLMLFLWKYIDDLIGKGFEWYVIMELMGYASATNVAMALPLSVLLSSIMTYGSLGENYELVAIKSAGISLTRAMYPMAIIITLLSVGAFFFSDYMLPKANLKYFSLLWDARNQKSANFLPEGVFSNSFPGYTIRVQHKDPDGQTLYDLTIYYKDIATNSNYVLHAKKGRMYRTPDNKYLVLELEDGIRYEESAAQNGGYNPRQTLTRFRFKTTQQKLDITGFKLNRTDEGSFKGAYQMMGLHLLDSTLHAYNHKIDSGNLTNYSKITPYIKYYSVPSKSAKVKKMEPTKGDIFKNQARNEEMSAVANALSEARSLNDLVKNNNATYQAVSLDLHAAEVEYHKKFTLSAACFVLFLIGAPLGAIIRKGGLGLPVVVSVIFFLIYYIIETIGEKSVKAGEASPIIGMWIAIFILTPIGMFLSYKAATDSALFDVEFYKRFFARIIKFKKVIK